MWKPLWFDQVSDLIQDHMKAKCCLKWGEQWWKNAHSRLICNTKMASPPEDASPLHLSSRMSCSLHRRMTCNIMQHLEKMCWQQHVWCCISYVCLAVFWVGTSWVVVVSAQDSHATVMGFGGHLAPFMDWSEEWVRHCSGFLQLHLWSAASALWGKFLKFEILKACIWTFFGLTVGLGKLTLGILWKSWKSHYWPLTKRVVNSEFSRKLQENLKILFKPTAS